jgi:hypothetical protein
LTHSRHRRLGQNHVAREGPDRLALIEDQAHDAGFAVEPGVLNAHLFESIAEPRASRTPGFESTTASGPTTASGGCCR